MRDYGIEAIPFEDSVDVHLRGITKSHDQGVTAPRKVGGKTRLTVFIASDVQTGRANTGFHELLHCIFRMAPDLEQSFLSFFCEHINATSAQFQIAVETLGDMYVHPD